MIKNILLAMLLLISTTSFAGGEEQDYDVSKISKELMKGADAVKRYELIRFEINNPGSAIYYYKRAVTILNENGDKHAVWGESYDKINSI